MQRREITTTVKEPETYTVYEDSAFVYFVPAELPIHNESPFLRSRVENSAVLIVHKPTKAVTKSRWF